MHTSIIFLRQGTIVLLVTPAAVELSIWIGLFGWGHPMPIRVWRWGIISHAVMRGKFGFRRICHYKLDYSGNIEDRTIESQKRVIF
jgi:hypothetical protein